MTERAEIVAWLRNGAAHQRHCQWSLWQRVQIAWLMLSSPNAVFAGAFRFLALQIERGEHKETNDEA